MANFLGKLRTDYRGLFTASLHFAILILGWVLKQWIGLLTFSLPFFIIFHITVYRIALAVVPCNDPSDKAERRKRALIFFSYVWGIQMPMWNVMHPKGDLEPKIKGRHTPSPFPGRGRRSFFPGLIRTDSFQVVGIENRGKYRVEGPGVIYTGKNDKPFEVVDLRTQFAKGHIQAFSLEGIPFEAEVSALFRIDNEHWDPSVYHQLGRANPVLNKGNEMSGAGLTFPYSRARVEAALKLRTQTSDGKIESWDKYVLAQVMQAAREVLAGRSIKDLWHVRENEKRKNAGDAISLGIRDLVFEGLQQHGIRLISAKAFGFVFTGSRDGETQDEIIQQLIDTWAVEQDREQRITMANARAEAEQIEQEARSEAQAVLLTSIVEGLEQAGKRHSNKDQEDIFKVYLDALKKMVEEQTSYNPDATSDLNRAWDRYLNSRGKRGPSHDE